MAITSLHFFHSIPHYDLLGDYHAERYAACTSNPWWTHVNNRRSPCKNRYKKRLFQFMFVPYDVAQPGLRLKWRQREWTGDQSVNRWKCSVIEIQEKTVRVQYRPEGTVVMFLLHLSAMAGNNPTWSKIFSPLWSFFNLGWMATVSSIKLVAVAQQTIQSL